MPTCRICGETKSQDEFHNVTNFTKYKKHPVQWCRDCQKLWLEMRKERVYKEKILSMQQKFEVSFQ